MKFGNRHKSWQFVKNRFLGVILCIHYVIFKKVFTDKFALDLVFFIYLFKFVRALNKSIGYGILCAILSFIPIVNLIVLLRLVKEYSKITGIKVNFFLMDKTNKNK